MPVYVTRNASPASTVDAALVERTRPPGLNIPRNRQGIFPQVWELVGEDPGPLQRRDLANMQGRVPLLIENRGNYDMGFWTLYWTSELGGWAARTPRPGILEAPGPSYAMFRRMDVSRCTHPDMVWIEHRSTYRTADCSVCHAHFSHDSGD